jgi:carboxyl-terminal processing protease
LPPIARDIPKLPPEGFPAFDPAKPDTDFQLKEGIAVLQSMALQRRAAK